MSKRDQTDYDAILKKAGIEQQAPDHADEPLLRFFEWTHLPLHLQQASYPFQNTASDIVNKIPKNSERDMALRKLLEAKDCAVRAVLMG